MLSDLDSVKLVLGIPDSDTTQDAVLTVHLTAADAAVKKYTKRHLELAVQTEYQSTTGQNQLALRERPIRAFSIATTLTQGSTTATVSAGDAGKLTTGIPAVLLNYLSVGTTVSGISGGTLTLSLPALLGGSVTVFYGLSVWFDGGAYFGQAPGAFGADTMMYPGVDYVMDVDSPDGSSRSGLITRLGGGVAGVGVDWPWSYCRGTLTARLPPAWPATIGGLKAVYASGYCADDIPPDLAMAVNELTAWLWRYAAQGGVLVTSESYRNYSYALGKLQSEPDLMGARQLLSRYREVAL